MSLVWKLSFLIYKIALPKLFSKVPQKEKTKTKKETPTES